MFIKKEKKNRNVFSEKICQFLQTPKKINQVIRVDVWNDKKINDAKEYYL